MVKLLKIGLPIFLFLYWFFRDSQFWDVTMYIGKKGCGKTCTIAKLSQKYLKKGYNVYCSIEIPGTRLFNPRDLKSFTPLEQSIILVDEVGLIWDNRQFKSFDHGFTEWFKYSRQYRCKVFLFSQSFDIDLKIRSLVDHMYLMTRIGKVTLARPVIKTIGISQDQDGNGRLVDTYRFGSIFGWQWTLLSRYYGLFKSYDPPKRDLITASYQDYNEISQIYASSKRWLLYRCRCAADQLKEKVKSAPDAIKKRMKREGETDDQRKA